jgi:hypothetical protein
LLWLFFGGKKAVLKLILKIKNILFTPKNEWAKIKEESSTISQLFFSYNIILAAIPPVMSFFSNLLFGNFKRPFTGWSWNLVFNDFLHAVSTYLFYLTACFFLGIFLDLFAPVFSSVRNSTKAYKLVSYSLTPFWLGGFFYFIPRMGWTLNIMAGLYGIYLLYLGISSGIMKTPKDKVFWYFLINILFIIILIGTIKIILVFIFYIWRVF